MFNWKFCEFNLADKQIKFLARSSPEFFYCMLRFEEFSTKEKLNNI